MSKVISTKNNNKWCHLEATTENDSIDISLMCNGDPVTCLEVTFENDELVVFHYHPEEKGRGRRIL